METMHEVRDGAKAIVLAAHIKRHGWQGSPLVADGLDFAATYTAQEEIWGDWYQSMVQTLATLPTSTRNVYGIDLH